MSAITRLYNYPGHAVCIFDRIVREQHSQGRRLRSVGKGHFLGTGVSLKFEFVDAPADSEHQLTYFLGPRRDNSDGMFQGWQVFAVLPMRLFWITIGYFYVLARPKNAA